MAGSGGARNRSGPAKDPSSGRSDRAGLKLSALPREGYAGDVPPFPVPGAYGRVLEVWEALWRTPQAAAWAVDSWRWPHVADLARLMVLSEDEKTPVGVFTHIRQARADLGLTPAGLIENGWAISVDEVGARRAESSSVEGEAPKRRLRAAE